jgi:hypothetical protein
MMTRRAMVALACAAAALLSARAFAQTAAALSAVASDAGGVRVVVKPKRSPVPCGNST